MQIKIVLFLLLIFNCKIYAQDKFVNDDDLVASFDLYNKIKGDDLLYVHTDKNIYTNNEKIFFSAYLLKSTSATLNNHNVLSIRLVNTKLNKTILFKQYALKQGIGSGTLKLPDTIPSGKYLLIAYTNILITAGKPSAIYKQAMIIKNLSPIQMTGSQITPATTRRNGIPGSEKINQKTHIKFYPEGGVLVNGLTSKVAWESLSEENQPKAVSGILFENAHPMDTVSSNAYGAGYFILKPLKGKKYTFKLLENAGSAENAIFALQDAINNGIAIKLNEGVVNDSVKISISSTADMKVKVLVHNYRDLFASTTVMLKSVPTHLSIALPGLPKGLATITIIDSAGKPLIERLFFAHYSRQILTSLEVGRDYHKKTGVDLNVKISDSAGHPVKGIFSIACVQSNRINTGIKQTIEDYYYLTHHLGDKLPANPMGAKMYNKEYLESQLLIQGWVRYNWMELMSSSNNDSLKMSFVKSIGGKVTYNHKSLKKAVELMVVNGKRFFVVPTDRTGTFNIPSEMRLTDTPDGMVKLSINGPDKNGFIIETKNSDSIDNRYFTGDNMYQTSIPSNGKLLTDDDFKFARRTVQLNEVVIKSGFNNLAYGSAPKGANPCGDYYCVMGILNCKSHRQSASNRPAVKGETYIDETRVINAANGTIHDADERGNFGWLVLKVMYQGCEKTDLSFTMDPIYSVKEHYQITVNDANEEQLQSTLFWKAETTLDEKGASQLRFLTGDIPGPFNIIIQGVSEKGVFYTEKTIIVE
jgi:hypothetical protein